MFSRGGVYAYRITRESRTRKPMSSHAVNARWETLASLLYPTLSRYVARTEEAGGNGYS